MENPKRIPNDFLFLFFSSHLQNITFAWERDNDDIAELMMIKQNEQK
jgi:hypothetical protein